MITIDTKNFQDSDFESESFIKLINEHLPEEIKIKLIFRDSDFSLYPIKSTFSIIFSDSHLICHFTTLVFKYPEFIKQRLLQLYNKSINLKT